MQVALKGRSDYLNMYVTCYTVPTICAPLDHQPIEFAAASYPHLNGLPLADDSSAEVVLEIEMLIGADFFLAHRYWACDTGGSRDLSPFKRNWDMFFLDRPLMNPRSLQLLSRSLPPIFFSLRRKQCLFLLKRI